MRIIKKAFTCFEGLPIFNINPSTIYADSAGEAKSQYHKSNYVPFLDVYCRRNREEDIVAFEGTQDKRMTILNRIKWHEWRNALDKLVQENAGAKCVIWSGQWRSYWRENAGGYTLNVEDAGIYDIEDAHAAVCHNGLEKEISLFIIENKSGKAWKHHIAATFLAGTSPTHPNGAGLGGTIFFDYEYMLSYLRKDGRSWFVAELELENTPVIFNFLNTEMATIMQAYPSKEGFKPIKL